MSGSLWPVPGAGVCKRVGCEAGVNLSSGHTKSHCSESCRILENVAVALVNCKRVPRGRNHRRDVQFVTRIMPVGNVVPIVLSRKDFGDLISIRNAYVSRPRGRNRNT